MNEFYSENTTETRKLLLVDAFAENKGYRGGSIPSYYYINPDKIVAMEQVWWEAFNRILYAVWLEGLPEPIYVTKDSAEKKLSQYCDVAIGTLDEL